MHTWKEVSRIGEILGTMMPENLDDVREALEGLLERQELYLRERGEFSEGLVEDKQAEFAEQLRELVSILR